MDVKFAPFQLTTTNGHKAEISGMDIDKSPFLTGSVNGKDVTWDIKGSTQCHTEGYNLDTSTNEFQAVESTLRLLAPDAFAL